MSTVSNSASSLATSQLFAAQRPAAPDKSRFATTIDGQVSSGQISAADGAALTGALDSIEAGLAGDRAQGASGTSGSGAATRLDPSQLKAKVDSLIDAQVSGGSLTSAQGAELKEVFSKSGEQGGAQAARGGGHHRGGGRPASSTEADPSTSATTSSADSGSSADDLLQSFLKQLQSTQATASGYAASGSTGGAARSQAALLLDFDA